MYIPKKSGFRAKFCAFTAADLCVAHIITHTNLVLHGLKIKTIVSQAFVWENTCRITAKMAACFLKPSIFEKAHGNLPFLWKNQTGWQD